MGRGWCLGEERVRAFGKVMLDLMGLVGNAARAGGLGDMCIGTGLGSF